MTLQPFHPNLLRTLVFDFDGTLAATPHDFRRMHEEAREALLPFAPVPKELHGPVLEDIDAICRGLAPAQAAKARQAAMAAVEKVELETAREGALFPFTRPVLARLKHLGLVTAVITRNCSAAVFLVFPDMLEYVSCVLTRDDVERVKPDPLHLLSALAQTGGTAASCLMIGDHPMDIQTGKRANAYTAGVYSGSSDVERLAQENPDMLAANAGALLTQLEERFAR